MFKYISHSRNWFFSEFPVVLNALKSEVQVPSYFERVISTRQTWRRNGEKMCTVNDDKWWGNNAPACWLSSLNRGTHWLQSKDLKDTPSPLSPQIKWTLLMTYHDVWRVYTCRARGEGGRNPYWREGFTFWLTFLSGCTIKGNWIMGRFRPRSEHNYTLANSIKNEGWGAYIAIFPFLANHLDRRQIWLQGLSQDHKAREVDKGVSFMSLKLSHRFTLEVPIQEGSRSLATDEITSNHAISTVALIVLIMSTFFKLIFYLSILYLTLFFVLLKTALLVKGL